MGGRLHRCQTLRDHATPNTNVKKKKTTCNASKPGNLSISFVNFQSSGHLSVPYLIVPEVIEKVSGRTAGCTDLNINSPVGLSLRGTLFKLFGRLTFTFPTFFHTQESVYGSDMLNLLPTPCSLHFFRGLYHIYQDLCDVIHLIII